MKPEHTCTSCQHSSLTLCDLGRVGWPYAGSWCSAYLPRIEDQKAIQTPEAQPSQEIKHD